LNPDTVRAVAESGDDLKLFTLASLELWLRANVDEVRPAPPTWDELLA